MALTSSVTTLEHEESHYEDDNQFEKLLSLRATYYTGVILNKSKQRKECLLSIPRLLSGNF